MLTLEFSKKIESIEKDSKDPKNVRITPLPSSGSSKSEALSMTRVVQMETMSKDIEKLKTSVATFSLQGNKSLDINSDNVNKWVQGKFEAFIRAPDTRNQIKEVVVTKVEAFQVRNIKSDYKIIIDIVVNCCKHHSGTSTNDQDMVKSSGRRKSGLFDGIK